MTMIKLLQAIVLAALFSLPLIIYFWSMKP